VQPNQSFWYVISFRTTLDLRGLLLRQICSLYPRSLGHSSSPYLVVRCWLRAGGTKEDRIMVFRLHAYWNWVRDWKRDGCVQWDLRCPHYCGSPPPVGLTSSVGGANANNPLFYWRKSQKVDRRRRHHPSSNHGGNVVETKEWSHPSQFPSGLVIYNNGRSPSTTPSNQRKFDRRGRPTRVASGIGHVNGELAIVLLLHGHITCVYCNDQICCVFRDEGSRKTVIADRCGPPARNLYEVKRGYGDKRKEVTSITTVLGYLNSHQCFP